MGNRRREVLEHQDFTPQTITVAAPADANDEVVDPPRLVRGARQADRPVDRPEAGVLRDRGEALAIEHRRMLARPCGTAVM